MKMLKEGEEAGTDVAWEDQRKINEFSKLNARLQDFEDQLQEKQREKEAIDDVTNELELADEDELVKYRVGDVYVNLPLEEARERLEKTGSDLDGQIKSIKADIGKINDDMNKLKVALYAKFGTSINLERD